MKRMSMVKFFMIAGLLITIGSSSAWAQNPVTVNMGKSSGHFSDTVQEKLSKFKEGVKKISHSQFAKTVGKGISSAKKGMQWAKDKYSKAMEYKKMAEDMVDDVKNSKEYKIAMLSKEVAEETKELKELVGERKAKIKAVEEKYAVEEEVNKAKKEIAEENYRTELEILKNQEADDAEQGDLKSLPSKQEVAAIKEPIKAKAIKESIKEIPSTKVRISKAENANVKQQKVKAEHSLLPKDSMVSESLMRTTGDAIDNKELLPAEVETMPNTAILENGKADVEKINRNKTVFQENNVKAENAEEGAIKDFSPEAEDNDVLSNEVKESNTSINNIKGLKKSKGRFNTSIEKVAQINKATKEQIKQEKIKEEGEGL